MFKLNRIVACMLALTAAITLAVASNAEAAKGKTPKPAGKVEGTLQGVAGNGVVIRVQNGTLVSIGINASTKIELNDVRVPVSSLPLGSRTEALFDPATQIATKVESKT